MCHFDIIGEYGIRRGDVIRNYNYYFFIILITVYKRTTNENHMASVTLLLVACYYTILYPSFDTIMLFLAVSYFDILFTGYLILL